MELSRFMNAQPYKPRQNLMVSYHCTTTVYFVPFTKNIFKFKIQFVLCKGPLGSDCSDWTAQRKKLVREVTNGSLLSSIGSLLFLLLRAE